MLEVVSKSPWNFDNILVLVPWLVDIIDLEAYFKDVPLWVQVWHLPDVAYNEQMVARMMATNQGYSCVQLRELGTTCTRLFHVRLQVNHYKPIRTFIRLGFSNGPDFCGYLQYERLPTFCFA